MTGALGLGWRNIWRNRRRTFISMSAIGIGLFMVVFYTGMVSGVMGDARNQLDNGGLGHVEIYAKGYRARRDVAIAMADTAAWRAKLTLPPGTELGARVLARGLATSARGNEPIQLMGVEWENEKLLSAHLRQLTSGKLPDPSDDRGVLVGEQLAERLALKVGSKLRLMVARTDGDMGADLFRVRGVFHSISSTIGQRQVYISQPAARTLLGLENVSHQVVVQLTDPSQADAVAAQIKAAIGGQYDVLTWGELLPVLKRMESLMDNVVFALAFFIYFLVGLGVLNTTLMSVLERTREFGVLMALGTRRSRVLAVVLSESFWIASLSVIIGGTLGALVTWHFSQAGLHLGTGAESIQMEGATISTFAKTRFSVTDILKASSFVYVMALVVGLYPASRITRLQPAEALRRT